MLDKWQGIILEKVPYQLGKISVHLGGAHNLLLLTLGR